MALHDAPRFELRRVAADGTQSAPEIVPITEVLSGAEMNRRGFLGAAISASTLLLITTGCATTIRTRGARLKAHSKSVEELAITPDGKFLLSASRDGTIKIWSMPDGRLEKVLKTHTNGVYALAITPDGQVLASGSRDKTIKLWSLPQAEVVRSLKEHQNAVFSLAISPDGELLASGSGDKTIKLWALPEGRLLRTLEGHAGPIDALAITPDGKMLASGSRDLAIKLWSLPDGRFLATIKKHTGWLTALSFTPDGRLLASASHDKTIRMLSMADTEAVETLKGHRGQVYTLVISPDGKMLASGGRDKTIKLWWLPDRRILETLEDHKDSVTALTISPDARWLASGSFDGVIIIRDLQRKVLHGYLFDPNATSGTAKGVVYEAYDKVMGRTVTYTLPCGSPIPPGAVCTCNCVPGTFTQPRSIPRPGTPTYRGGGTHCSCDKVCTCVPVCTCMAVPVCQAHRLLHRDAVVRTMAGELLLIMGPRESAYMTWAAEHATPALADRIGNIMKTIERGSTPDPSRWPSIDQCVARLSDSDEVIAIMAAQILTQWQVIDRLCLYYPIRERVNFLLHQAARRPWFMRDAHVPTVLKQSQLIH